MKRVLSLLLLLVICLTLAACQKEAPATAVPTEAPTQAPAAEATAEDRRRQVGSGDRSERIRTYNFPQSRVTDHRIGLTLYKLDAVMNGALDEIIDALITADQAAKLAGE